MDEELAFASIAYQGQLLRRGALSPVELTQLYLDRIDTYDEQLNAYLTVAAERALASAHAAEAAIQGGDWRGPLHGIPVALKDLFAVTGLPTTAGSLILQDQIAPRDATAARLLFEAGAVLLGKTQLVEFAFGGAGINHHYGTPWNPWDLDEHRLPGGSSSGSGVAVSAGLAGAALGTDTGGSVRIPASFSGLVGLKPTFGRVSNAGIYPLDSGLDSVGPMARTVGDAALIYDVLRGPDVEDPNTLDQPIDGPTDDLDMDLSGVRLCVPREYFWVDVDAETEAAVRATAQVFAELGAHVDEISLEPLDQLSEMRQRSVAAGLTRGTLSSVETCVRLGTELDERLDDFDPIISARMIEGRHVLATDYISLQRAWSVLRTEALDALQDVGALLVPTTPFPAPTVAETDDETGPYWQINGMCLRNTSAVSLLGLCAISLPCGFTRGGLPIGLQLIAKPWEEARLLRLAQAYESATQWHHRFPDLTALG
jgi:aspartyl-tRNA(Asn)/glutamyl-tRNA(Gln) amidotransferase subunit A